MDKKILKNGIKLYTYRLPNTHSISVSLYVKAGSAYENNFNNGITHFLEHLHFRSLGDWSQHKLYYEMERIGSTLRAATYRGLLRFYLKIRPKYFKKAVRIMKKLILANDWCEDEFQKEKRVIIDQIAEKNSYTDIQQYVDKTVWQNSSLSYPIMGTEDTINNLTIKDLIDYKNYIFSPKNMFFFVTGNFKNSQIEYIENVLENLNLNDSKVDCTFPQITFKQRKPDVVFINNSWHYIDVNISFSIGNKEMPVRQLILLNGILGEGVGSKLQMEIREKEGLATNIYSTVEYFKDAFVIHISFSVIRENLYKVLKMIVTVLNDLKNNIDVKDLETVLPFYTDNLYYLLDKPEELSFKLAYDFITLEEEPCDIETEALKYANIDITELMNCAKQIFNKEYLSIVVLGSCWKFRKREIRDIFEAL